MSFRDLFRRPTGAQPIDRFAIADPPDISEGPYEPYYGLIVLAEHDFRRFRVLAHSREQAQALAEARYRSGTVRYVLNERTAHLPR